MQMQVSAALLVDCNPDAHFPLSTSSTTLVMGTVKLQLYARLLFMQIMRGNIRLHKLSSRWFISAYDHIRSNPDIVKNGFKKVGITEALEKGLPEADPELHLQDLSENDPFSSDSDKESLMHSCLTCVQPV